MTLRTPLVVVLAGPNGAGKSTSASSLLRGALAVEEFVNADTIALGLSAYRPDAAAVAAGRVMLDRLRFLARARRDFAFETTLSGRGHARWLASLRETSYRVHLIFLALPTPDLAVARVKARVRVGGHDVPELVVRRRFRAGLLNFFNVYSSIADAWQMYDNADVGGPRPIAVRSLGGDLTVTDRSAWKRIQEVR